MSGALALVAALQVTAMNWDALPPLPFRAPPIVTSDMQKFVEREVHTRKCPTSNKLMRVDVAILVDEDGGIRTAVPRAIHCASVEQYVAAFVAGFSRNNLLPRMTTGEQWYRTSLSFTLAK